MAITIFILLILGCFMEGIAIIVITVPVFMPIGYQYHIDPVQFGVVNILCSMIGLLTPPVGMCLYTMSSISGIGIWELSRELLPGTAAVHHRHHRRDYRLRVLAGPRSVGTQHVQVTRGGGGKSNGHIEEN